MSAQSWIQDVLPDAQLASNRTGVPVSVILAQWGNETGWGTSQAWTAGNNYAGVSPGGSVANYPTRAAGLAAYIDTLLDPRYNAVRSAGTVGGAIDALATSGWAQSQYAFSYSGQTGPGGDSGPGSLLRANVTQNNLAAYDTPGTTGLTATPVDSIIGHIIDPWGIGGSAASGVAGSVVQLLVNAIREPALKAVGVAGAVGLMLLAAWQISRPARQKVEEQAGKAAKVAAVAA
jgi:hypothetical protein